MKQNLSGLVPHMSAEDYHAHSAIGSTTLARARRSWAHALTPFERTAALDFGSAFHTLAGEPKLFKEKYAKAPVCDRRTKEGKEIYARFEAQNQGKTILKSDEFDALDGMLASLIQHKIGLALLTGGMAEVSAFWTDQETGIACKCRPDYLRTNDVIVDIKTAEDASQDAFQRTLSLYGRHIQTAIYLDGLTAITGRKFTNFVHLVIEKKPPYAIAIYSLDDDSIEQGRREYKNLLKQYSFCQKLDHYPAYPEEVQTVSLPTWAVKYE